MNSTKIFLALIEECLAMVNRRLDALEDLGTQNPHECSRICVSLESFGIRQHLE